MTKKPKTEFKVIEIGPYILRPGEELDADCGMRYIENSSVLNNFVHDAKTRLRFYPEFFAVGDVRITHRTAQKRYYYHSVRRLLVFEQCPELIMLGVVLPENGERIWVILRARNQKQVDPICNIIEGNIRSNLSGGAPGQLPDARVRRDSRAYTNSTLPNQASVSGMANGIVPGFAGQAQKGTQQQQKQYVAQSHMVEGMQTHMTGSHALSQPASGEASSIYDSGTNMTQTHILAQHAVAVNASAPHLKASRGEVLHLDSATGGVGAVGGIGGGYSGSFRGAGLNTTHPSGGSYAYDMGNMDERNYNLNMSSGGAVAQTDGAGSYRMGVGESEPDNAMEKEIIAKHRQADHAAAASSGGGIEMGHSGFGINAHGYRDNGEPGYSRMSSSSGSMTSTETEDHMVFESKRFVEIDHKTGQVREVEHGPIFLYCAQFRRPKQNRQSKLSDEPIRVYSSSKQHSNPQHETDSVKNGYNTSFGLHQENASLQSSSNQAHNFETPHLGGINYSAGGEYATNYSIDGPQRHYQKNNAGYDQAQNGSGLFPQASEEYYDWNVDRAGQRPLQPELHHAF